jgi:DNA-binding transcriptional LysR family regulator
LDRAQVSQSFKNVDWDDFRLVMAVAQARTLPKAASQLGIDHSTVFRRLGQIEQGLGVTLFERHRSGFALTASGEEMVALAERLDADISGFRRKLAGKELKPAGDLRVTTNDTLLVALLTPLFAKFRREYPEIRLDIILSNQALNLSKRDADVAIRATDHPPETLVGRRAAHIGWALYGRRRDFPAARRIDPRSLLQRPWISLGDNFGALKTVQFVHKHVAPERVVYKVNTVLGLTEAVETGIGIGHLPCFIADTRPSLVRLGSREPEFGTALWLLTHADLRHSARVRVFLDFIAAEIIKIRGLVEGASQSGPAERLAPRKREVKSVVEAGKEF